MSVAKSIQKLFVALLFGISIHSTSFSEEWLERSPRPEMKPEFKLIGSDTENLELEIACGESIGEHGWFEKSFPVVGGEYYEFQIHRVTTDVENPRRSAVVRISWKDEKGNSVLADPPPGREAEKGSIPLAEPEHPLDVAPTANETDVRGTYRVPSKATQAVVELHLQWAPRGKVTWSNFKFDKTSAPAPRRVKLATIQYTPSGKSIESNRTEFEPLLADAAKQGANLVVMGETINYVGLGMKPHEVAETIPGPSTDFFARIAEKYQTHLVVCIYEDDHNVTYNTAVLLDPKGAIVGKYRKVCLPHAEIEAGVTPGDSYPVFETELGKIGMMICYDGFFPEVARELTNNGAEVIAWPVWGCNPLLAQARACENHVYIVSSTYSSPASNWMISAIFDHAGKPLAKATSVEQVVVVEVDLSQKHFWRNNLGDFHNMVQRHRPKVNQK